MNTTISTRNTSYYPACHTIDTSSYINTQEKEIDSPRKSSTPLPINSFVPLEQSLHNESICPNYFNELHTQFEHNQIQLNHKANSLQNEITSTSQYLNDAISNYKDIMNSLISKHNYNMNILSNELNTQYANEINAKNEEIQILMHKQKELSECNEELIGKMNQYINMINTSNSNYNEKVNMLETEKDLLEKEYNELKRNYERVIEEFYKNVENEKNGIRRKYDTIKKQMEDEYNEIKEYYSKAMLQKEIDAKGVDVQLKKDNEKLCLENKGNNDKIRMLMDVNFELMQEYNEKRNEIEYLKKEIERIKNENEFYISERKKYEKNYYNLNKEHNVLHNREMKLNRITNGKLSKKK